MLSNIALIFAHITSPDPFEKFKDLLQERQTSWKGLPIYRNMHLGIRGSTTNFSLPYPMVWYTIVCQTILYYTILYYTILYYTIPYYTILYYTILYYTILYYTILYYTILYYTRLD